MFTLGQRVRCKIYDDEGVVYCIDVDGAYQVYVEFDNNGEWDSYTKEGKLFESDDAAQNKCKKLLTRFDCALQ